MWKVEYTKRFLKELSVLPKETRTRAEKMIFEEILSGNPFDFGYVERMRGYPGKYKIRLGDYRIGLTIDKNNHVIILQRIAHRKDIYKISVEPAILKAWRAIFALSAVVATAVGGVGAPDSY